MVSAYVRIPLPLRLPVKIFQRQRSQIFCRGCLPGCPAAALWPSSGLCGLFLCRCRFPDRAGEGQRVRQRLPRGGRLYLVPSALCASCEGFQRQRPADLLQGSRSGSCPRVGQAAVVVAWSWMLRPLLLRPSDRRGEGRRVPLHLMIKTLLFLRFRNNSSIRQFHSILTFQARAGLS